MKSLLSLFIFFCTTNAYCSPNSFLDLFEKSTALQNLSEVQTGGAPVDIRNEVEKIMNKPLRISEVETILCLFDRISPLNQQDVETLYGIFYYWPHLQKEHVSLFNRLHINKSAASVYFSTENVKQLTHESADPESGIFINGVKYSSQLENRVLKIKTQWLYISNKFEPILYYGDLDGFLEKLQTKIEFSDSCFSKLPFWKDTRYFSFAKDEQGLCSAFSQQKLYTDLNRSFVQSRNETKKNNWILPLSILTGVFIAYELRNKEVSIHMPSFKF